MKRIQNFIKTTLLGGIVVILPSIILFFAFGWLFNKINNSTKPLSQFLADNLTLPNQFDDIIATLMVFFIIIFGCFIVGLFVRTRLGSWILDMIERQLLNKAPGYKMLRETIHQLFGKNKVLFSQVVLAQIYGNETLVTGFVTDTHDNGIVTIFVPTGPNPTSGFVYHLHEKYIHPQDIPVEEAMRSIISCGMGSNISKCSDKQASKE